MRVRAPGPRFVALLCAAIGFLAGSAAGGKKDEQVRVKVERALSAFDADPRAVDSALVRLARDNRSEFRILANVLISISKVDDADTFSVALRFAEAAVTASEVAVKKGGMTRKDTLAEARAFFIAPSIQYYGLLAPTGNVMAVLAKKPYLAVAFGKVVYTHAKVFRRLELRTLFNQAGDCFSILNQEFYNSGRHPELRGMADEIKRWSIELNKDNVSD